MRYGDAYYNDLAAAQRANAAASNVESGGARLNNFNNTGAAQNANAAFGRTAAAEYQAAVADQQARADGEVQWERSLQHRAMADRENQTAVSDRDSARKHGASTVMSNAMGRMGGGLLGGLTTSSEQRPAVSLYGSNGRRIGGTPLAGLA